MGCVSSSTKAATGAEAKQAEQPIEQPAVLLTEAADGTKAASPEAKQAEQPLEQPAAVLTEAMAEERALTQLKTLFKSIDANADGNVSKDELVAALAKDDSIGALIKEAGLNQDYNVLEKLETSVEGRVTWEEFQANLKKQAIAEVLETGNVAAVELAADEKALKELKKLFESLDSNQDGAISKEELAAGLNKDENVGKLVAEAGFNPEYYVLEALDTNADGRITWDEFEKHLRQAAKEEVKETGEVAAAVVLEQSTETDAVIAPKSLWCGC